MPRIDPLQLLKCLSVLLTPEGGILSKEEVPRLVNLMTKFSKKLVSKCVYILILKNTETSLVNMFMAEGGWNLIHTWLQDAIQISNWDLVKEILSLLLITPVDVERLKLNTIPKLVKGLTRVDNCKGVQELSTQLVQDWLTIVKNNTATKVEPCQPVENVTNEIKTVDINSVNKIQESVEISQEQQPTQLQAQVDAVTVDSSEIASDITQNNGQGTISTNTFYKVTVRDGKQVISRTPGPDNEQDEIKPETINDAVKAEVKDKKDDKSHKSKSSSSKSSSSKHSSSNSNKSSKSSSSSSSSSSKHKSSSSKSSSRDKDRDRKDRDKYKDKHKSNGSKQSSNSSSNKEKSDSKEKQAEKDKDTLAKIKPQSIDKLGRIPKKTDDSNKTKEIKKPTMSIEVRKNTEERPKTVKVYNSKRRSTGLEDEAKPAPPRPIKKQATPATVSISVTTITTTTTTTPSIIPPPKRQSPIKELSIPPEKKLKFDLPPPTERPGSIKLIPPKPKPPVLQESDIFMDALAASATTKKESKKRKRRPSVTKDTPSSPTKQQPQQETETPTSPTSSPLGLKNIAAPNFYQDTLNTEKSEDDRDDQDDDRVERGGGNTPTQNEEVEEKRTVDGLKGALMYTKRKGPKKSVRFNDNDLTQVRFFELDETERVNVTKTFMDMAKMEMNSEREALQLSRKLANEDVMEVQTNWRVPYLIDIPDALVIPGCKSLEKDIQFAREKTALQALYFDKRKIPDSPDEPIPETHQMRDPIIIPLEDAETQEMDLRNTPWPEPKGSPPPPLLQDNLPPQLFNNIQLPFQNFPNGPPQPFQGLPPRFPMGQGPQPNIFGPPNMLPNGNMLGPPNLGPQHDLLHQGGPLNPNAFGPGPAPDFNPMMNDNFQLPFNPPNMNMFPPNNFNMNRGGNRGGGFRRGGGGGGGNNNGGWVRMNGGPGNWNNRGPPNNRNGGGGNNGRVCKNIKNHGFCRNMDKCPYVHPK